MKTENFLDLLADDVHVRPMPNFIPVWLMGITASLALFVLLVMTTDIYSVRASYFEFVQQPIVAAKQLIPLAMMLALAPFVKGLVRPEAGLKSALWRVVPFAAIMGGLFLFTFMSTPVEMVGMEIQGKSLARCLLSIPLIALPSFASIYYAMSRGAPTRPTMTGFYSGLLAGTISAAIYAICCDQDSPLFYALWYPVGILSSGVIGAFIGNRFLRW